MQLIYERVGNRCKPHNQGIMKRTLEKQSEKSRACRDKTRYLCLSRFFRTIRVAPRVNPVSPIMEGRDFILYRRKIRDGIKAIIRT